MQIFSTTGYFNLYCRIYMCSSCIERISNAKFYGVGYSSKDFLSRSLCLAGAMVVTCRQLLYPNCISAMNMLLNWEDAFYRKDSK